MSNSTIDDKLSNFSALSRHTGYDRAHISRVLRGLEGYSDSFVECISNTTGIGFLEVVEFIQRKRAVNKTQREAIEIRKLTRNLDDMEKRVEK